MKRALLIALRIALPMVIIGWLLLSLEPGQLQQLRERSKNWGLLSIAFAIAMLAVCITFVRWYLLVRALHLPFRLRDSFRLGFLGYLLNFVSVGAVGGDIFKAFFIAREQPGRRTEAVATVVIDRIVGLYGLLLVTCLAILINPVADPSAAVTAICNATYMATAIGGLGVLIVLPSGFTRGRFAEFLGSMPFVGDTLRRLLESVRLYRDKRLVMLCVFAMSMLAHGLLTVSFFLIAAGIFESPPTFAEHFIIVPLSNVAGALPFTPAGLGSLEFAMDELYQMIPLASTDVSGVLVALTYRIVTIAIAVVGVVYYWASRKEVRKVLKEAGQQTEIR